VGVVGNNYGMDSPRVSRDLVSYETSKTLIFWLFSQYSPGGGGPKKVEYLPTSPNNQFQDHYHQDRLEKCMPRAYFFAIGFKKMIKKINKTVSKPDF